MTHFHKVEKITRDEQVLDKIICDWCKGEFKTDKDFNGEKSGWDENEFEFHVAQGSLYPEGDNRDHYRTELCHKCRFKLMEKMKELGINIFKTDNY